MNSMQREALIERYAEGERVVAAALEGISEAELAAREAEDEWSVREIVHHLADSELIGAVRLRLLIAQEEPFLAAYDQEAFVRRLYPERAIEPSLAVIGAARAATIPILRQLQEEEWQRCGLHSESGRYTVGAWLEISVSHLEEHAKQIQSARARAEA